MEGVISVEAALTAASRDIQRLYIRRGKLSRQISKLEHRALEAGVIIEHVPAEEIDRQTNGKTHGGVMALVGPRQYVSLGTLIAGKSRPFVVMLDGIEDPFNFGYAIRAFYAAGVDGLVVRSRNWQTAAGVVARASAGASELIPTAKVEAVIEAIDFFRDRGLTIAHTAKQNAIAIYEADLAIALFLLIGGEKRGITRSARDKVDLRLQIPYGRVFEQALGTTAAAGALAFEIMRQRRGSYFAA